MTEPSAEALLQHAGFLRALARSLVLDEGQDAESLLRPGMSVTPTVYTK